MERDLNRIQAKLKHLSKDYEESLLAEDRKKGARKVFTRCVFERIVEVDTKCERYDVEAVIEVSWHDDEVFNTLLKRNSSCKIF